MRPTGQLQQVGQSLWLDSISREPLASGRLRRYIQELSVTGLTSNPTIFDHAIEHSSDYDDDIRASIEAGLSSEEVFFALALAMTYVIGLPVAATGYATRVGGVGCSSRGAALSLGSVVSRSS